LGGAGKKELVRSAVVVSINYRMGIGMVVGGKELWSDTAMPSSRIPPWQMQCDSSTLSQSQ
jgi:hypothetical protein